MPRFSINYIYAEWKRLEISLTEFNRFFIVLALATFRVEQKKLSFKWEISLLQGKQYVNDTIFHTNKNIFITILKNSWLCRKATHFLEINSTMNHMSHEKRWFLIFFHFLAHFFSFLYLHPTTHPSNLTQKSLISIFSRKNSLLSSVYPTNAAFKGVISELPEIAVQIRTNTFEKGQWSHLFDRKIHLVTLKLHFSWGDVKHWLSWPNIKVKQKRYKI